jgi:hypothetical protein
VALRVNYMDFRAFHDRLRAHGGSRTVGGQLDGVSFYEHGWLQSCDQVAAVAGGHRIPDADRLSVRPHGRADRSAGDCDTGWHIRTGEWILAHHAVPYHDLFSLFQSRAASGTRGSGWRT